MTIEKVYTTKEIAEMLKVSEQNIRIFIKQKKIKAIKIGKNYRVKESDLNQYLQQ